MNDPASISVIIPTLNEADNLAATLESCVDPRSEQIVVDCGSRDATADIARSCGARFFVCRGGCRALQMNQGAERARGRVLLFLHADTLLPPDYCSLILNLLDSDGVSAGAFELEIAGEGWPLRLIERAANARSRILQLPYGDQALFVTARKFHETGGFRELPIMEDFDFVRRLRRSGGVRIAAASVRTSARRWRGVGPWRTTLINQLMIAGYLAGASPKRLADFYRSRNGASNSG